MSFYLLSVMSPLFLNRPVFFESYRSTDQVFPSQLFMRTIEYLLTLLSSYMIGCYLHNKQTTKQCSVVIGLRIGVSSSTDYVIKIQSTRSLCIDDLLHVPTLKIIIIIIIIDFKCKDQLIKLKPWECR